MTKGTSSSTRTDRRRCRNVYAAGDIAPGPQLAIKAAAEGATAALAMHKSLVPEARKLDSVAAARYQVTVILAGFRSRTPEDDRSLAEMADDDDPAAGRASRPVVRTRSR